MDRLLSAKQVAAMTGLPRITVYRLAETGGIPCMRILKKGIRFPESAIDAWIKERTVAAPRPPVERGDAPVVADATTE